MKRCLLMAVAALTAMSQLNAQGLWGVVKRADSLLTARYRRGT